MFSDHGAPVAVPNLLGDNRTKKGDGRPSFLAPLACFRKMKSAVVSPDCTEVLEKHQVIEQLDFATGYVAHSTPESLPAKWRNLASAEILVSSGRLNVDKFIAGRTDIARLAQANRLRRTRNWTRLRLARSNFVGR
jgi:hypothetical protein